MAKLELAAIGLPAEWGLYEELPGGLWARMPSSDDWRAYVLHALMGEEAHRPLFERDAEDLTEIAGRLFGEDSPPEFCARVLLLAWDIRFARKYNYKQMLETRCFDLGGLVQKIQIKRRWERHALSGEKRASDLGLARDRYNTTRAQKVESWRRWVERIASDIWARNPKLSISAVARVVSSKAGTDPSAPATVLPKSDRSITRAISHLRPKNSGRAG
jgi:hypothetical protein